MSETSPVRSTWTGLLSAKRRPSQSEFLSSARSAELARGLIPFLGSLFAGYTTVIVESFSCSEIKKQTCCWGIDCDNSENPRERCRGIHTSSRIYSMCYLKCRDKVLQRKIIL